MASEQALATVQQLFDQVATPPPPPENDDDDDEPPMIDRDQRRFSSVAEARAAFPDRTLAADILSPILDQPHMEQRSDEWFLARQTAITASDIGAACGVSKWASPAKVALKKIETKPEAPRSSIADAAMAHGVKYEDAAAHRFEQDTGEVVIDVGCLVHHSIYRMRPAHMSSLEWFRAIHNDVAPEGISDEQWSEIERLRWLKGSPDGVCLSGAVIEIKCPASGFEYGSMIPEAYIYQLKLNMAVVGADRGYFIRYVPPVGMLVEKYECVTITLEHGWFDHVLKQARPVWDWVLHYRSFKALHPDMATKYVQVDREDGAIEFVTKSTLAKRKRLDEARERQRDGVDSPLPELSPVAQAILESYGPRSRWFEHHDCDVLSDGDE